MWRIRYGFFVWLEHEALYAMLCKEEEIGGFVPNQIALVRTWYEINKWPNSHLRSMQRNFTFYLICIHLITYDVSVSQKRRERRFPWETLHLIYLFTPKYLLSIYIYIFILVIAL